jgi:hypothetical protein
MTKILLLLSPAILALLLLAAHLASKSELAGEAEREAPIHKAFDIRVRDGVTTLSVDERSQARSGIRTRVLAAAQSAAGPLVYATVLDVQPLFELASRYAAGAGELRAAQAELAQREAEAKRVQTLYEDGQNVSRKVLDLARAEAGAGRAKAGAAQATIAVTGAALRQQFGPAIAAWAMAPSSADLAALMAHQAVLLRVTAASEQGLAAPQTLSLSLDAGKDVEARLVSASPQVDAAIQGQAWFYRAAAPLAAGTRLSGRLATRQATGVRIPAEAVVWYGGQPWTWVRTNAATFERRLVGQGAPGEGGFVVDEGFRPGDAVVVQGAQLLLSEESRALATRD